MSYVVRLYRGLEVFFFSLSDFSGSASLEGNSSFFVFDFILDVCLDLGYSTTFGDSDF